MEPPRGTLSRRRASFPLGTEFVSPREIQGDPGTRHPDPRLSRSGRSVNAEPIPAMD